MSPSPLPPRIARSLQKLGSDIEIARKKRRLTVAALCERAGISAPLYQRLVTGAPGTSVGAYAMVLFALGTGTLAFEAKGQRHAASFAYAET